MEVFIMTIKTSIAKTLFACALLASFQAHAKEATVGGGFGQMLRALARKTVVTTYRTATSKPGFFGLGVLTPSLYTAVNQSEIAWVKQSRNYIKDFAHRWFNAFKRSL